VPRFLDHHVVTSDDATFKRRCKHADRLRRSSVHTGGDRHWGSPEYARDASYLTEAGANWLVEHRARLVGIDAVNIDDTSSGGQRPAHTVLLAAGIPIVDHLTRLDQLPLTGARFTAVPPRIADFEPSQSGPTRLFRPTAKTPVNAAQPRNTSLEAPHAVAR
jgi:kynurenine formamidase